VEGGSVVRLLDALSARVLPIGAFLYVIFLAVWDVFFYAPFGELAMWAVVLESVGLFLVGFACLGPGWMWVTRFHPRYVKLRSRMYKAPRFGGFVALVLLLAGVWALVAGIQRSVNIVGDLRSELERRDGVVCTHFNPEIRARGKGGHSIGAFMDVRYADGVSERIQFYPAPRGAWGKGKGAEAERLCWFGTPFTLWRWPRTGVIADIASSGEE
jgi:putative membrane protein